MRAYKFTRPGAVGPFTGFLWPPPAGGSPGPWVDAPEAAPCRGAIHACGAAHLPFWVREELWVMELDGDVVESPNRLKLVARRGRLVEQVEAWGAGGAAEFGRDCALRARDLAVDALVAAGMGGPAEELGSCSDLVTLAAMAESRAGETAGVAGFLASYAADSARSAAAGRPAVSAYVTAVAAGDAAAGEYRNQPGSPAALAERTRQAAWIVEHLNLL